MLKRIKDSIFDILRQADWLLLCLCCGAALFGLVMIASATNFLNSWKMVIVQACAIVLGVGIYFLMSQIDLTEAAKRWKWLLGFGIVMFLLLKTPLGIENNGNRAWLGIQGFPANIQPAEIVKLTFILVLSRQLVWVKENWGLKSLRSIAFLAGHVLLMVGLYYVISSDMGSALVYIFIFAAMAFVAGVAARWFIIALLGGGAAFYLLWELDKIPDYMKERFMVVFDHNLDPLGAGWQPIWPAYWPSRARWMMVPTLWQSCQAMPSFSMSLSLPTYTTCSSTRARTPWPLCSCTSSMRCWSMGPE